MSVSYKLISKSTNTAITSNKKIAILALSNPPVNGISIALRKSMMSALKRAKEDDKVDAIIMIGDGKTFPAGADIAEFEWGGFFNEPNLMQIVKEMDGYEKPKGERVIPLIAAIHGTALGGGLELALACHYRVAVPSAKVGLPEVHLGILPCGEGTQRLPRVAGISNAIDMMITGKHVPAKKAFEYGIIDALSNGDKHDDLLETAIKLADNITPEEATNKSLSKQVLPKADDKVYNDAIKTASKIARGQVAPLNIIKSIRAASESKTFADGVAEEQRLFQELNAGPQSKALQYMFFADRDCQKVSGVDVKKAKDLKQVGVVGIDQKGIDIVTSLINKGIRVTVCDTKPEKIDKGLKAIENSYKMSDAFKNGKISEADIASRIALITCCNDPDFKSLSECDAVIEAVDEDLQLKKNIFKKLDKICKSDALLCTTTNLDVDKIASATLRPECVVGTHFISPINSTSVIENVKGAKTSNESIAKAMKLSKSIGKTPIVSGNSYGFIGNRTFESYIQQAIMMLEEGASPSQIDGVFGPNNFGMSIGPFLTLDSIGNDIGYHARRESSYPYNPHNIKGKRGESWLVLADDLYNKGRYGQSKGVGWYKYEGKTPKDDPEIAQMIKEHAQKYNIKQRKHTEQEIIERCLLTTVNQGLKLLEEKIALRGCDIDVIWNYGYGFPRYRGGPMHYVDQVIGLPKMKDQLLRYLDEQPELPEWQFKPAMLLEELIISKTTIAQFDKKKPAR